MVMADSDLGWPKRIHLKFNKALGPLTWSSEGFKYCGTYKGEDLMVIKDL